MLYNKVLVYKEAQDAIIAGFCQEDFYRTYLRPVCYVKFQQNMGLICLTLYLEAICHASIRLWETSISSCFQGVNAFRRHGLNMYKTVII
jgi:hypothetical protein